MPKKVKGGNRWRKKMIPIIPTSESESLSSASESVLGPSRITKTVTPEVTYAAMAAVVPEPASIFVEPLSEDIPQVKKPQKKKREDFPPLPTVDGSEPPPAVCTVNIPDTAVVSVLGEEPMTRPTQKKTSVRKSPKGLLRKVQEKRRKLKEMKKRKTEKLRRNRRLLKASVSQKEVNYESPNYYSPLDVDTSDDDTGVSTISSVPSRPQSPMEFDSSNMDSSSVPSTPRKRGRPRKSLANSSVSSTPESTPTSSEKKRGRPRKSASDLSSSFKAPAVRKLSTYFSSEEDASKKIHDKPAAEKRKRIPKKKGAQLTPRSRAKEDFFASIAGGPLDYSSDSMDVEMISERYSPQVRRSPRLNSPLSESVDLDVVPAVRPRVQRMDSSSSTATGPSPKRGKILDRQISESLSLMSIDSCDEGLTEIVTELENEAIANTSGSFKMPQRSTTGFDKHKTGRKSNVTVRQIGRIIPEGGTVSIVRGYSNQADERFSVRSRGSQCTPCSVVALCLALDIPLSAWQRDTVELTLDTGDNLYRLSKDRLTNHNYAYLNAEEILPKFRIGNMFFDYECSAVYDVNGMVNAGEMTLRSGLASFFGNRNQGLLTTNSFTFAVFFFNREFYLFDSHSRDGTGKPISSEEGKACLLSFPSLDLLAEHLLPMSGNAANLYSLTSPDIRVSLNVEDDTIYPPLEEVVGQAEDVMIPSSATSFQIGGSYRRPLEEVEPQGNEGVSSHHCGPMSEVCSKCGALFFKGETWLTCCSDGKISLPPFRSDRIITEILRGRHEKSPIFFRNARGHNNRLAMASAHGSWLPFLGRGNFSVRIEGMLRHTLADIDPNNPRYGSIYFVETERLLRRAEGDREGPPIDHELLELLYHRLLESRNQFVLMYQNARDFDEQRVRENPEGEEITTLNIKINATTDRRNFNAPTCLDEVAAIYASRDGDPPPPGFIRLFVKSDPNSRIHFKNVPRTSPISDPLCYPILFPYGDLGWDISMYHQRLGMIRRRVSMREHYAYRLMCRNEEHPLHHGGRLFQQYVIDAELKVTGDRLNYIKTHQDKMHVEHYNGLQDYVARVRGGEGGQRIGTVRILPSSFTGGRRFMEARYQDAMTIVAETGKPTWFVTFTCNPQWPEIKSQLGPHQKPQDRPDIVCRVFYIKFKHLMKKLTEGRFFGEVTAWVYAIEFQKRGLPHAHILITVADAYVPRTPEDVDRYISAEIPDAADPDLHALVMKCMVHGPCGPEGIPNSKCRENRPDCAKKFPRQFQEQTLIRDNGFVFYRRREDGREEQIYRDGRLYEVDNRWIVEYNPTLTLSYSCHICVLYVSSVKNVKYLFKYITKGSDAVEAAFVDDDTYDECQQYQSMRYISAMEAAWRLLSFSLVGMSHIVEALPIHLPGQRGVFFEEGREEQALQRANNTNSKLEAFFVRCREDDFARGLLYHEMPLHYRFVNGSWKRRVYNLKRSIIGRIYTVSPREIELFHLRILLVHVRGPVSFDDILTVEGVLCDTFKESAIRRNLLATDDEWVNAMRQAHHCSSPAQMRRLFAALLCHCTVQNPVSLYDEFIEHMAEDYARTLDARLARIRAFRSIEGSLRRMNRTAAEFGIGDGENDLLEGDEILLELADDREFWADFFNEPVIAAAVEAVPPEIRGNLNAQQGHIFEAVSAALENDGLERRLFFVQGCGGSGKTFLFNWLIRHAEHQRKSVIAIAYTGIAALLLKDGRTAHGVFRFPLHRSTELNSAIRFDSPEAQLLREVALIVWDELGMVSCAMIDCADRLMRDLRRDDRPFGGCCMIFGGDVHQMLSVQKQIADQIDMLFTRSLMWPRVAVYVLSTNVRAQEDQDFSEWLIDLGRGVFNQTVANIPNLISIPVDLLKDDVVEFVFGDVNLLHRENMNDTIAQRAILCPKLLHCALINSRLLLNFPGDSVDLYSVDSVKSDNPQAATLYREEYLNSLIVSGMPPHKLTLKVGVPVILLRNICIREGLCNGTRLIVVQIRRNVLELEIVTGSFKGKRTLIPRMDLESSPADEFPFILKRRQFPVNLCFALTVNKAQGQTFDRVGIFLPTPCFTHGQLYVALSRVRRSENVGIQVANVPNVQGVLRENDDVVFTKNIVYDEVIRAILGPDVRNIESFD